MQEKAVAMTEAPVAPTTTEPAPEPAATTEPPATDGLGDAGKKALDSERREKRAAEKRASDLEARLKEFEDRDKTETQKLAERAEATERRAAEAESRALRLEVAFEKGLTPAQAKRLVGTTREELETDADEVLRDFPVKPADPTVPSLDLGQRANGASPALLDPKMRDLAQIEADLAAKRR